VNFYHKKLQSKGRGEMSKRLDRRKFLKSSLLTSAGVAAALSFEEKVLLAAVSKTKGPNEPAPKEPVKGLPSGKIGNFTISRLIAGGNLISGYAHSRNLIYVSELLKHYFTDEKVFETLRLCEENGINTAILRLDKDTIRILNKYRKDMGGKIQWIAQVKAREADITGGAKEALDNGAVGVFSHGGVGDEFFKKGKIELLGEFVSFIQEKKAIAGIGSHILDVPMAVEKTGIKPDFYFKTLNTADYECKNPQQVIEFMEKVRIPWIAYKVLGAGVTHPKEGFKYAFDNGADFICVGMYDFQIKEDAVIAKAAVAGAQNRKRSWMA
jgi:hypothetical protein